MYVSKFPLIHTDSSSSRITNILGSCSQLITLLCSNLGVLIDGNPTLKSYIKSVIESCFFQLGKIYQIKSFISTKNLDTVIQAFISSWVDYCNSLFSVCSKWISLQLIEKCSRQDFNRYQKMRVHYIYPFIFALAAKMILGELILKFYLSHLRPRTVWSQAIFLTFNSLICCHGPQGSQMLLFWWFLNPD